MPHRLSAAKVGPLAIQLEVEFLDRLSEPVREKKARSVSAIIRTALERYDFTNMVVVRTPQVLISVRLPVDIRHALRKTARTKHTSIGQLVRTAVEAYLPQLEMEAAGQLEMPIVEPLPIPPSATKPGRLKAARQAVVTKTKPARVRRKPAQLMTKKRKG